MTYGGGEFALAVEYYRRDDYGNQISSYQQALFSADGLTWRPVFPPQGRADVLAVADCSLLVASPSGSSSQLWFSRSGGATWSSLPLVPSMAIRAIASGNSRYVAVGNDIVELKLPLIEPAFPISAPFGLNLPESSSTNLVRYFESLPPCLAQPIQF